MREQMNIVIVGHVDHGKSTVIGRLLADTDSLPEGKLEFIREKCKKESKQFEYAFLLDALKDEQSQGITIDSARCFFKTKKRDYIIIDAPGHIEFLKNMISGAARAEAALLVIDADEGIQENSKRHGYMLSMLGIKQVVVVVNKMDLVNYDKKVFENIQNNYSKFLSEIGMKAKSFVPVSAIEGDNIIEKGQLSWFEGDNVLQSLDNFSKEIKKKRPFRMPVQDVYKFTDDDNRRIIAGRIISGSIEKGDDVIFLPSNKKSKVKSIEGNNAEGYSTGFTLSEELYLNRGELMCKEPLPYLSSEIKASVFWMGKEPLTLKKKYKLKIGTSSISMRVKKILRVLDASNLKNEKKEIVERHEVAEIVITLRNPIAFDTIDKIQENGRFVIVDDYEIAGGGIITNVVDDNLGSLREDVSTRDSKWDSSLISKEQRGNRYAQKPCFVLITGPTGIDKKNLAKHLEIKLFNEGRKVYFLGIRNILRGLDKDVHKKNKEEHIRRFAEVANILVDSGQLVFGTASDFSDEEISLMRTIISNVLVVSIEEDIQSDLKLSDDDLESNIQKVIELLRFEGIIFGSSME